MVQSQKRLTCIRTTSRQEYSTDCLSTVTNFIIFFTIATVTLFSVVMYNTISFATWNVRGIKRDISKRHTVGEDCKAYNLDIIGLQETKCKLSEEVILPSKYKLILLEQRDSYHGGLGFVISPRLQPYIKSYSYISDRAVSYTHLTLPTKA